MRLDYLNPNSTPPIMKNIRLILFTSAATLACVFSALAQSDLNLPEASQLAVAVALTVGEALGSASAYCSEPSAASARWPA